MIGLLRSILAGAGAMALAVGGAGLADVNLGTQQAIASAYAVFGQPGSSLSSASATIEYVSTSAGLGSTVDSNNISLQDRAHSKDATSYSLIETGTLPLRTNSRVSEVVVSVPMISPDGVSCLPAFTREGDADGAVTAFLSIAAVSGSSIVSQFNVSNDLTDGSDVVEDGVSVSCPSAGVGTGALTFSLTRAGTGTFTLIFDLGYEFDGARRVNNGALEIDGDDGEPFTGTYEFTLDVSLSTESGSGGNPCGGNCGVGLGGGGGNGTSNEGQGRGPGG